jgi:integrase
MKTKPIEIRKGGNVRVKIYVGSTIKNGQRYPEYKVCDYFTFPGQRKFWAFADEAEARKKANEIADSIIAGQSESTGLTEWQQREYLDSKTLLAASGIALTEAVSIFCRAMDILQLQPGHLLRAAEFFKANRPDQPIEPKRVKDAVKEFLAAQKASVSQRRYQALNCYLGQFEDEFDGRNLNEIGTGDLETFLEKKKQWSPKTHNDFLGIIGLLYKFAQKCNRRWVPTGYNPAGGIERLSACEADVELMEPDDLKQMFERIDPELIPFLTLWCLTGCRKEEAARVTWQQIHSALKKGELELTKDQTKNGRARRRRGARKMPMLPNARAWFEWWLRKFGPKDSGMLLPLRWNTLSQLSDLPKFIRRNTGIIWKNNGPRNSYISYRCKIIGNVVDVADEAGNSPAKIERHYRAKSVLLSTAKAWFGVMPPIEDNVLPMPQPESSPSMSMPDARVSACPGQ